MEFKEFLTRNQLILFDGAMGTQLAAAGLEMSGVNNLTHPDQVRSIHQAYAATGCDILTTNTLTMNRIYIETHETGVDVRDVNLAGARLARNAAQQGQFVFGDLSSTGQLLEPLGDYSETEVFNAFCEQAKYLAEGGVDGFIIETMLDLREALCAVRACKTIINLPIILSMVFHTFERDGWTIMGNSVAEICEEAGKAGVVAVGANCGSMDPFQIAIIVALMKQATNLPILAQPNAGKPRLVDEQTVFDMTPEEFGRGIGACLQSGATLVGGCCGTSLAHINAAKREIEKFRSQR
jgi:5-methyltetrahydrofolate--homocysteine methyltransferase